MVTIRHSSALLAVSLLLPDVPLHAQLVPEGIHQDAEGPAELCGITGRDALEVIEKVRASPLLRAQPLNSERFELFAAEEGLLQFVFTRPSEAAHPAVTCRRVYQDESGAWVHSRNMRCDSTRDACDRLFLEFQELDRRAHDEVTRSR